MLTIQALRDFGADVDQGLGRCLNNEGFYLRLVGKAAQQDLSGLQAALEGRDLGRAFELCHAMKGVFANLALTPLLTPVAEMTELLRAGTDAGCAPLFAQARERLEELQRLARE